MQLIQYKLFFPNDYRFQKVIWEALCQKNISVLESLMKHPSFAAVDTRFLQDCLEKVTMNAKGESGEWECIQALIHKIKF